MSFFKNVFSGLGKSARLLRAAEKGDAGAVQRLLAAGADVNAVDTQARSPFLWAPAQRHEAVVELLLERGADIAHWTPLTLAATFGHLECVRALLEHGSKDIGNALCQAIWHGHRDIALLLKEQGADAAVASAAANYADRHGKTNLMGAAEEWNTDRARLLIEFGADVNAVDESGETALMQAAWAGAADIVHMLLDAGADVNAADEDGVTALMRAAEFDDGERSTSTLRLLLDAGADVGAVNKEGKTALAIARENGATAAARTLEAAGAR